MQGKSWLGEIFLVGDSPPQTFESWSSSVTQWKQRYWCSNNLRVICTQQKNIPPKLEVVFLGNPKDSVWEDWGSP